jgi:hypothetical protein
MKLYSRRTSDRSKAIFNYRFSRVLRVVDSAFGICASNWKIKDKATGTKVDTGVEIVKCMALLHNIITDIEGLHDFSTYNCGSLDTNGNTQLKNPECITVSVKQTQDLLCEFFHSPAGSVLWQEEAIGDIQ